MADGKIKPMDELAGVLAEARRSGKKIVLCHGVFDLMHPGHVLHFQAAKKHGDILVISVTPDHFVNKGPGRPVFSHRLRMETLSALECVDYVSLNEWPTAVETIHKLKPHAYVKGSEYSTASADITGKIVEEEDAVKSVGGELVFTHEQEFSSSRLINQFFSKLPPLADSFLREFRKKYSSKDILASLQGLDAVRVLVVGEAIVDQYCYCVPLGKSPKETIIATRYSAEENFAGGSLAIANHIAGFCRKVTLVTYLGQDTRYDEFIRSKLRPNVQLHAVRADDRPTITKRRYVEPSFLTKMFEIQYLDDTSLPDYQEKEVLAELDRELPEHDLVVVADFGHGLLTEATRNRLSSSGKFLAVNTQTNSANLGFNPATKYTRADYVCLHEGELKLALRTQYGDVQELASKLRKQVGARYLMVTRGPNGSMLVSDKGHVHDAPPLSMRIVDRVGAGDTFFALTAPCVYRDYAPDIVGFIGNCAGAVAVETVCNREPIDPVSFQKFVSHLLL